MRKFLIVGFLLVMCGVLCARANAAPDNANTPNPAPVSLTPQQAHDALTVLSDPVRRSQVENTLRAVAAAGALAAPPQAASASAASGSASAVPANAASSVLAKSLTNNGLASLLTRQAGHWFVQIGTGLRHSVSALLDFGSVARWWRERTATDDGRDLVMHVAWTVLLSLVPSLLFEFTVARMMRRPRAKIAARGVVNVDDTKPELAQEERAAMRAQATAERIGDETALHVAEKKTDTVRGRRHAARHWTLLQRLPSALLYAFFSIVPLLAFMAAAALLISIFIDEGTADARVAGALIDVYLVCRVIQILSGFFVAPDAPGLRLIQMRDESASFTHDWVVRIVCVAGAGVALANAMEPLGLSDDAHIAILKAVSLVVHVMIAFVIFQCRKPVAARIRERAQFHRSFALVGNWLADIWAGIAIFFVLALWFVWALDVQHGYQTLFHLGGVSVIVLVAARVVAIVAFGALGRIFHSEAGADDSEQSIAYRHAYGYYPFMRGVVQTVIAAATVIALFQVWGLHVLQFFTSGGVGNRLASALVTIVVAALFAVLVWEAANVMVERRLAQWTESGDRLRAARLRTLLPMMRSALFIVIAMVVVLTGLSEIGVNTGPLLASASIFGVALGFGSQKLVQDLITGIFLLMENAMQVGDWVTLAGVSGTVEYLSIRTVRLRGGDGSLYTVPFSSVSTVNNTNRGIGNAAVRVSIAMGEDVDLAISTLKEIGTALREDDAFKDGILSDFSFWGVDAVDGSTVTLAGQIQCRDSARWPVQREFNRRILNEFTARGIEIANPQRNFVIVNGGEPPLAAGIDEATADQRAEPSKAAQHPTPEAAADQRGGRTSTGEPSNAPPLRSNPSRS
ncbi:Potassium efflux system KefA protein / Small-conductance mechanosensitive channel [Caballeronia glathei]|uniref:Mechanosensitive ion channel protein n=1 Tax=Caballeronia glathei TaxID=60547 RepID=A0A069PC66_9BURK|nr:mechanosensitive ion channel domain-containing protein [Caballeronia glathei]KDR38210.1 mechanosensitive ion channel protein [Caballeronia glathei]CDY79842.1 Potassium efflux system KefA protein / Small-conductance mechanosensitive channel [Caballeronia glathei]